MGNNQTSNTEDQLVTMHKKARERKKRKFIITLSVVILIMLAVLIIGVSILREKVSDQVGAGAAGEVLSSEVTRGNIQTTVSGSGTLAAEDVESLDVLSTLEIVDYYVEIGDSVKQGDLIATVTNSSLLTAMAEKQVELDTLDDSIADASADSASTSLGTSVSGRVKKISVSAGDDVATAMYEQGALVLLSLDGYMAVDISSEEASVGDTVNVILSDESSVEGIVEKQVNGTATILVTDNGTTLDDTATVQNTDGNTLGTGTLYIHSSMAITGYAGTVSYVNVSENDYVYAGATLIGLTDTETSANYDTLLKERAEIEEQLNDLIKIHKEGGICSPIDGTVDSLEETESTSSMATGYGVQTGAAAGTSTGSAGTGSTYVTAATILSNTRMEVSISIDETDILSLSVGQEAYVSIDSIGSDTYSGVVTEVNKTASSSSGVTSYTAVVAIDKTESMLSGMSASVVITIEGTENALLVPIDAVHQTSATAYVYTEYDEESGEFSGMKEVTIGLSNSNYVEIKEGLSEGDTVYYTESEKDGGFSGMMNFDGMGSFPGGMTMPGGDSGSGFSGGGSFPSGGFSGGGFSGGDFSGGMPGGMGN